MTGTLQPLPLESLQSRQSIELTKAIEDPHNGDCVLGGGEDGRLNSLNHRIVMSKRVRKLEDEEKKRKRMEIDYKKMEEGTCRIKESPSGEKWAVCKESGKIKIYPIKNEE